MSQREILIETITMKIYIVKEQRSYTTMMGKMTVADRPGQDR